MGTNNTTTLGIDIQYTDRTSGPGVNKTVSNLRQIPQSQRAQGRFNEEIEKGSRLMMMNRRAIDTGNKSLNEMNHLLDKATLGMFKFTIASIGVQQLQNVLMPVLTGMYSLAKASIGAAAQMQMWEKQLENTTGSAYTAKKEIKALFEFAQNKSPFDVEQIVEAATTLQNLGFSAKDVQQNLLPALNNMAAASKGKGRDMVTAALAMVDGVNGQFKRLNDTYSITDNEMKARSESVKKSFGNMSEQAANKIALLQIIHEKFGNVAEAQMDTLQTSASNLRQAYFGLKVAIGQALAGENAGSAIELTKRMKDLVNSVTDFVELHPEVVRMGVAFGAMGGVTIGLLELLKLKFLYHGVRTALSSYNLEQKKLKEGTKASRDEIIAEAQALMGLTTVFGTSISSSQSLSVAQNKLAAATATSTASLLKQEEQLARVASTQGGLGLSTYAKKEQQSLSTLGAISRGDILGKKPEDIVPSKVGIGTQSIVNMMYGNRTQSGVIEEPTPSLQQSDVQSLAKRSLLLGNLSSQQEQTQKNLTRARGRDIAIGIQKSRMEKLGDVISQYGQGGGRSASMSLEQLKEYNKSLKDMEAAQERLVTLLMQDSTSSKEYRNALSALNAEVNTLESSIVRLQSVMGRDVRQQGLNLFTADREASRAGYAIPGGKAYLTSPSAFGAGGGVKGVYETTGGEQRRFLDPDTGKYVDETIGAKTEFQGMRNERYIRSQEKRFLGQRKWDKMQAARAANPLDIDEETAERLRRVRSRLENPRNAGPNTSPGWFAEASSVATQVAPQQAKRVALLAQERSILDEIAAAQMHRDQELAIEAGNLSRLNALQLVNAEMKKQAEIRILQESDAMAIANNEMAKHSYLQAQINMKQLTGSETVEELEFRKAQLAAAQERLTIAELEGIKAQVVSQRSTRGDAITKEEDIVLTQRLAATEIQLAAARRRSATASVAEAEAETVNTARKAAGTVAAYAQAAGEKALGLAKMIFDPKMLLFMVGTTLVSELIFGWMDKLQKKHDEAAEKTDKLSDSMKSGASSAMTYADSMNAVGNATSDAVSKQSDALNTYISLVEKFSGGSASSEGMAKFNTLLSGFMPTIQGNAGVNVTQTSALENEAQANDEFINRLNYKIKMNKEEIKRRELGEPALNVPMRGGRPDRYEFYEKSNEALEKENKWYEKVIGSVQEESDELRGLAAAQGKVNDEVNKNIALWNQMLGANDPAGMYRLAKAEIDAQIPDLIKTGRTNEAMKKMGESYDWGVKIASAPTDERIAKLKQEIELLEAQGGSEDEIGRKKLQLSAIYGEQAIAIDSVATTHDKNTRTIEQEKLATDELNRSIDKNISLTESKIKLAEFLGMPASIQKQFMQENVSALMAGMQRTGQKYGGAIDPRFKDALKPFGYSKGGVVPGVGNSDTVPALLTPGEYVVPKDKVQSFSGGEYVRDWSKVNQTWGTDYGTKYLQPGDGKSIFDPVFMEWIPFSRRERRAQARLGNLPHMDSGRHDYRTLYSDLRTPAMRDAEAAVRKFNIADALSKRGGQYPEYWKALKERSAWHAKHAGMGIPLKDMMQEELLNQWLNPFGIKGFGKIGRSPRAGFPVAVTGGGLFGIGETATLVVDLLAGGISAIGSTVGAAAMGTVAGAYGLSGLPRARAEREVSKESLRRQLAFAREKGLDDDTINTILHGTGGRGGRKGTVTGGTFNGPPTHLYSGKAGHRPAGIDYRNLRVPLELSVPPTHLYSGKGGKGGYSKSSLPSGSVRVAHRFDELSELSYGIFPATLARSLKRQPGEITDLARMYGASGERVEDIAKMAHGKFGKRPESMVAYVHLGRGDAEEELKQLPAWLSSMKRSGIKPRLAIETWRNGKYAVDNDLVSGKNKHFAQLADILGAYGDDVSARFLSEMNINPFSVSSFQSAWKSARGVLPKNVKMVYSPSIGRGGQMRYAKGIESDIDIMGGTFYPHSAGESGNLRSYLSSAKRLGKPLTIDELEFMVGKTGSTDAAFRVLREMGVKSPLLFDYPRSGGSWNYSGSVLGATRKNFASGGLVPGVGNSDTVPALLTPGEYVVPKDKVQRFAKGGEVKPDNSYPRTPSGSYDFGALQDAQQEELDKIHGRGQYAKKKPGEKLFPLSGTGGRRVNPFSGKPHWKSPPIYAPPHWRGPDNASGVSGGILPPMPVDGGFIKAPVNGISAVKEPSSAPAADTPVDPKNVQSSNFIEDLLKILTMTKTIGTAEQDRALKESRARMDVLKAQSPIFDTSKDITKEYEGQIKLLDDIYHYYLKFGTKEEQLKAQAEEYNAIVENRQQMFEQKSGALSGQMDFLDKAVALGRSKTMEATGLDIGPGGYFQKRKKLAEQLVQENMKMANSTQNFLEQQKYVNAAMDAMKSSMEGFGMNSVLEEVIGVNNRISDFATSSELRKGGYFGGGGWFDQGRSMGNKAWQEGMSLRVYVDEGLKTELITNSGRFAVQVIEDGIKSGLRH